MEKQTWNQVILRIIDTTWNIRQKFRLKDKQNTLMKYGVVYKLTCFCGSSRIGHSRRNLINRFKEHSSLDKSEVYRQLTDNPDHNVGFAKPDILFSAGDFARLLILESLFIQKYEPLLNVDSKFAPLYLFNTRITRFFAYLELPWCPKRQLHTIYVLRYPCFSLNCFLGFKCEHFITVLLSMKSLFRKPILKSKIVK